MKKIPYIKTGLSAITLAVTLSGCASDSQVANSDEALLKTSGPRALQLTADPITPSNKWKLIWNDEFDGDEINKRKWSHEENCWGGGNNEQQCYTDRASNSFVKDGKLHIVAKKGRFTGPDNANGNTKSTTSLPYTSARLRTMNKGDWKYGRFDIRAKLPTGQGTWPAIWMLPTDYVFGGWAASGEIDIMEAVNLKAQSTETGAVKGEEESRVFGTLHFGKVWPDNEHTGQATHLPGNVNPGDDFHTYSIEWEEGEIRWYIDNVHFATQKQSGWYSQYKKDGNLVSGGEGAPFNQKFHLLLNLAVGGNWAAKANEGGIDKSAFPQKMEVDYVRVYRCTEDRWKGKGCAAISDQAKFVEGVSEPEILPDDPNFGKGPVFEVYKDALSANIAFAEYDPGEEVKQEEVEEAGHGKVWKITKKGAGGNVYLRAQRSNLSHWMDNGQLVFDLKVENKDSGTELLVKMDSGWPNASDITVQQPPEGTWGEVRIDVAELIGKGNRYASGKANISEIGNVLVVEPLGKMTLKIDNIRFEYAK
jgi:beta-glucanase (GH16 family)